MTGPLPPADSFRQGNEPDFARLNDPQGPPTGLAGAMGKAVFGEDYERMMEQSKRRKQAEKRLGYSMGAVIGACFLAVLLAVTVRLVVWIWP